jgi:DNA-binding transcriptional regulator LsrR (DeoR family)
MLYAVARLHYVAELSQVKIARQLGLSTATISRLLARARAEGIVRIEVRDPVEPEALGRMLAERLGLRRVSVADVPVAGLPAALATPLGQLLAEAAPQPGAVVALGWGRAIRAVIEAGLPLLPGVSVVAATGGLQQQAAHFQINEFVRLAAAALGGVPHFLHAPYLPSAETRASFLADPVIAGAVALWDRIDVAVVGVGLPPRLNPPEASVATESERRLTDAAGDVIRHYFTAEGALIDWEGAGRLIAAAPDQLRRARLVIGVAAGVAKAPAIIGAARAGLISALVTDVVTAEAVLDALGAAD